MERSITVERVTAARAEAVLLDLVAVLQDSVASGASIGFLPPFDEEEASAFWREVIAEVRASTCVLLLAFQGGVVVGTVNLALATKPNASHRAEVRKLLVLQRARRQGVARALLAAVEWEARAEGRSLLVLDTKQGDVAEGLYRRYGYVEAGVVPDFARNAAGGLDATVVFYRLLA